MFALAIWDKATRRLFLARDRFGVKPLYYIHQSDGSLIFGSEIKSLLPALSGRPALNYSALPDFLANHAPSGDRALFLGIKRFPPAHTLVWHEDDSASNDLGPRLRRWARRTARRLRGRTRSRR